MPRPQSEAEYLARLVPPSAAATGFGRRTLLKGALASGAALSVGRPARRLRRATAAAAAATPRAPAAR